MLWNVIFDDVLLVYNDADSHSDTRVATFFRGAVVDELYLSAESFSFARTVVTPAKTTRSNISDRPWSRILERRVRYMRADTKKPFFLSGNRDLICER